MANPFDQFATDIKAAIPQSEAPPPAAPAPTDAAPPSFNIMAQPSAAPKPVMNAPPQQPPPPPAMGGGMYGQPPPQQQPPMGGGMYGQPPPYGQPGAMVPSAQPPNQYGGLVGMGGAPPPAAPPAAPGGPPPLGGMYGQPPPPAAPPAPPAEAPPAVPPPSDPFGGAPPAAPPAAPGAMVPAPATADPFGLAAPAPPAPAPAVAADPFGAPAAPVPPAAPSAVPPPAAPPAPAADADPFGGAFGGAAPAPPAAPPAAPPSDDPFGAPAAPAAVAAGAVVPSTAPPSDDPFGVFGAPAPAPAAPAAPASSGDPWADMGFGPAVPDAAPAAAAAAPAVAAASTEIVSAPAPAAAAPPKKVGAEGLPEGGEWYDARIFTPTLGVMFFKPQELTDSLFLQTDKSLVEALDERPVVAFIVEGSSARSAGVELGHVLVKVNGIDVKNPKEASRLIKEGPRPLPLLFYVPDTTVVVAEGEHMVKYDTKETGAPVSAKDWKPKYVVIGGIIAQPWMMNMYRSKSEYDIAVIETQARRPVSVKVKQFSLQGARIQNDWQGPQMVKYKNKLHPWKYIVVLPVARNPIKISSPNLSQLKPVHEGIRRVLMAQQRGHGQQARTAAPARQADPYARHGNSPVRTGVGHAGHRY